MIARPIPIILAVAGLGLAVYVVATAKEDIPSPPPAQPPSTNPFVHGIAALGLVEPASRMIDIASPEPGRVVEVMVGVGEQVQAGDPLFRLDTVPLEAEMLRAKAALGAAQAEVRRIEAWPRAEDFPPVEAEVKEARARLDDATKRMGSLEAAMKQNAASDDEVSRQRFLVSIVRASLANAEARLARMKAGSWSQDLLVAQAAVAAREADIAAIDKRLNNLTVRAPRAATVLQRNIEPGEYATVGAAGGGPGANQGAAVPMILGDLSTMHVRAQVDEEDTPMLRPNAKAVARVRGAIKTEIPLTMVRIEPYARPKTQITGSSTELIDTRVIEAVFKAELPAGAPPIFPGQVVDVYIESAETDRAATPAIAPEAQAAKPS
jgi:HlyD family secretion protein